MQNRSNQVDKFQHSRDIEASTLYEVGFKGEYQRTGGRHYSNSVKLGVVPIKRSFFGKLTGSWLYTESLGDTIIQTTHNIGLMVGTNLITNDLIEYRPMGRAQFFVSNKARLYLTTYPHKPLLPYINNVPYTYLTHWSSINRKRPEVYKHEF